MIHLSEIYDITINIVYVILTDEKLKSDKLNLYDCFRKLSKK